MLILGLIPGIAFAADPTDVTVFVSSGGDVNAGFNLSGNNVGVVINGASMNTIVNGAGLSNSFTVYQQMSGISADIQMWVNRLKVQEDAINGSQDQQLNLYGSAISKLISDLQALQTALSNIKTISDDDNYSIRTLQASYDSISTQLTQVKDSLKSINEQYVSISQITNLNSQAISSLRPDIRIIPASYSISVPPQGQYNDLSSKYNSMKNTNRNNVILFSIGGLALFSICLYLFVKVQIMSRK